MMVIERKTTLTSIVENHSFLTGDYTMSTISQKVERVRKQLITKSVDS